MAARVTTQRCNMKLRDDAYIEWVRQGRPLERCTAFYGLLLYHALTHETDPVRRRLLAQQEKIGREDPAGTGHVTLRFPSPREQAVVLQKMRLLHKLIAVPLFNYHIVNVCFGLFLRRELPPIPESLLLEWRVS